MLKLKHISDSNRIAPIEAATKPATLKSQQEIGFDFVIENNYISGEEPIKFTYEQMVSIFRNGVPDALLQRIPRKQMIAAHEERMLKDEEYKKHFTKEEPAPKPAPEEKPAKPAAKKAPAKKGK